MCSKVLHVVESLDRGAVERWLVRMLRHARQSGIEIDWTFYCVLGPGMMDDEARKLGARVVYSPVPLVKKLAFIRALRAELRRGKYEIFHCHHDLMSAVYLLAALSLRIHHRIVHVHNADENLLTPSRVKRVMLGEAMRFICLTLASKVVGISNHTLDKFLKGRPRRPGRDVVHYYGVDSTPFTSFNEDRRELRHQFGFPVDTLIMLFAGRIVPEKNPVFVVDVLAEVRRRNPRVMGVFVGAGSLESAVLDRANQLGVKDAVRMLGWREDLPKIMSCSDLFILSRPEQPLEGFGLAVVEAQLAGMRMLLSEGIASDPLLPTAIYRRLPLAAGSKLWAKAALDLLSGPSATSADAQTALRQTPMDMDRSLNALMRLHE